MTPADRAALEVIASTGSGRADRARKMLTGSSTVALSRMAVQTVSDPAVDLSHRERAALVAVIDPADDPQVRQAAARLAAARQAEGEASVAWRRMSAQVGRLVDRYGVRGAARLLGVDGRQVSRWASRDSV